MGSHFQTVVDLDATAEDAPALAARALDWLVAQGIVRDERTDCVLGAPLGHPPGPRWASAVAVEDWEPGGGLRIEVGRTVFHGGQGDAQYAVCPHCATRTRFCTEDWEYIEDGAREPFDRAISAWHDTGAAAVTRTHCGRDGDLTAWAWADDFYAFGHLGFEFWDWDEFDPRFLDAFGTALGGHRVVRVWGKL
ncbi:hypothetical protein [Streptomyces vilmorinianum]|uniref:hypothetical protein n=1 Tax=Streptomyces vilmorinianum TaxID=3051092 RepID=UPI0010FAD827|nr:hypothetical protein [Streptomyces vilmorinianum]